MKAQTITNVRWKRTPQRVRDRAIDIGINVAFAAGMIAVGGMLGLMLLEYFIGCGSLQGGECLFFGS